MGVGRDQSDGFWRGVIRTLLARGALQRDGEHGGLVFAPSARAILRGETAVMLKREEERAPPVATPRAMREETPLAPEDVGLFERLRAWRGGRGARAGASALRDLP